MRGRRVPLRKWCSKALAQRGVPMVPFLCLLLFLLPWAVSAEPTSSWLSGESVNETISCSTLLGKWSGTAESPALKEAFQLEIISCNGNALTGLGKRADWAFLERFTGVVDGRQVRLDFAGLEQERPEIPPASFAALELSLTLEHGLAGRWQDQSGTTGAMRLTRSRESEASPTIGPPPAPSNSETAHANAYERPLDLFANFPETAHVGETVTINISARNVDSTAHVGTIAVTVLGVQAQIPEQTDSYDLFLPSRESRLATFVKDGALWHVLPWKKSVITKAPHLELYDEEWLPNTQRGLAFPVNFLDRGTAILLIRATFSNRDRNGVFIETNRPMEGVADQQGLPCMRIDIKVE